MIVEEITTTPTTVADLFQKSFWGPKEYAAFTRQSIPTARKQLVKMQNELEIEGFKSLSKYKVSVSAICEKLGIEYEYIKKTGGLTRVIS